ncbi:VWA domain-containing protein [Streptomyces sp. AN091965]|uniref:VWA domain-containing protein n=1 Tax=Streptomyces sp. AN091965 TaxID=2927803 RepID=UPI001F605E4B|nr:VWA domain-containing protein [Streptomyces sp. AN091965]MCI3935001.1 VWA domain-containing protein [Streptomyces sp. AN091965]
MVETGAPRAGGTAGQVTVGLEVSQWKYLSGEASDPQMHAVLSVRVDGAEGGGPVLAQVLALDCSGSMTWPPEKLHAAQEAAVAAIRELPDGTPFAVVRGNEQGTMAYPGTATMARASYETRERAERVVHGLVAGGGTCIGAWLDLARRLLTEQGAPVGHVLLLTDGKNEHDEQMPLAGVLEECAGRFVCDAWGIGDGWDARELLAITRRLHGSASSVREEEALPAEYEKLVSRLLTKTVPELAISVTPMPGAEVRYLKQVFPAEAELTPEDGTERFVTRAWGDETRRYQLCLFADPAGRPRREDLQLAVVAVDVPGAEEPRLPEPQPCLVHWTDNPALSRHTDAQVEHFEQHQRLGEAVAAATDAHRRGERDLAEHQLGRAAQLARAMGADEQLDRLARLVRIDDASAGRVTLRPDVTAVDFEHLIAASSHSSYGPASGTGAGGGTGPGGGSAAAAGSGRATVPCPVCSHKAPAAARFCPSCGHSFEALP